MRYKVEDPTWHTRAVIRVHVREGGAGRSIGWRECGRTHERRRMYRRCPPWSLPENTTRWQQTIAFHKRAQERAKVDSGKSGMFEALGGLCGTGLLGGHTVAQTGTNWWGDSSTASIFGTARFTRATRTAAAAAGEFRARGRRIAVSWSPGSPRGQREPALQRLPSVQQSR